MLKNGSPLANVWGCAEGATRDFSREKNVLNRYIFGFPLGKHSPLVPLTPQQALELITPQQAPATTGSISKFPYQKFEK